MNARLRAKTMSRGSSPTFSVFVTTPMPPMSLTTLT
jgi:hypothetical protein